MLNKKLMIRSGLRYIYYLIFSLLLLCLLVPGTYAQVTSISGIVNDYSKVTAIPGPAQVQIDNNDPGFAINDKVLIIQMKGAELDVNVLAAGGTVINSSLGDYGYYEFIIIEAVSTSPPYIITFRNNLLGSYDPDSYVQLVKVPEYQNVIINGPLTCETWNPATGTGGVLTFLVDNNVYLNADIDVSETGFEGGISDEIQGLSIPVQNADPDLFDFTEAENKSAHKGKGIGSHIIPSTLFNYDDYARGRGRFGSAGGGGNGRFAGGGGGASYGNGGEGGPDLDGIIYGGGKGGESVLSFWVTNRYMPVVMGGGGGAGGKGPLAGDIGSDGGRGGGIIIILADTIFGNGNSIKADGESVWPENPFYLAAEDDGGAGGGGAAGAIVISSNYSSSSSLTITAEGGDGGHTRNFNGQGGGGSGGLIFTNSDLASSGIAGLVDQGEEGSTNYLGTGSGIPSGFSGKLVDTLLIRLNGFLFNTIVSDVTKSRVDSICSGDSAPKIVGTTPVGGLAPYTYQWQKRTDNGSWGPLPDTGKDLDLTVAETDTILLRRIVSDSGIPLVDQIIDTSKTVTIIVQPVITGKDIGYDTIICYNQDPDPLIPKAILHGGNLDSFFPDSTFTWHSSKIYNTNLSAWDTVPSPFNERNYDPPVLTETFYYYRAVQSGRCYDTSNVVTVTVLPSITDNNIGYSQEVCEDSLFIPLAETTSLGGGDGSYVYDWQVFDGTGWVTADGPANQLAAYDPNQISYAYNQDTLIRRYVYSGADNVCVDSSNILTLKVWSDITDNIIYADQTTSQGDPVTLLIGDMPGGGDTNVAESYEWQDSTKIKDWSTAGGTSDQADYQPPNLVDTTWYRRIVTRGDCQDISDPVVINVHPAISNDTINLLSGEKDTIICNGQDIVLFKGSQPTGGDEVVYAYKWEKSTDNVTFTDADGIITNQDYDPPALTTPSLTVTTYFFRRSVTSGASTGISDTITVTVLPDIEGNIISGDQTICKNTGLLIPITAPLPAGGDGSYGYLWEESADNNTWFPASSGVNTNIDYDPGSLSVPTYYRRRVTSPELNGCDTSYSNSIFVDIYELPIGSITGISVAEVCAGDDVTISLDMSAAGQAPYDVVLNDGKGGTLSFTATTDIYNHSFNPGSTGEFTDYTYQFTSLIDDNNCVAEDVIGNPNLTVYTVPAATISTATPDNICGDVVALEATPSVGTGLWSCPDAAILSAASASTSATTSVTVDGNVTYTFTWTETNVICSDAATIDITFWEQPGPVDAGTGETLPPLTTKYPLNATAATAGSGLWTAEPDNGQEFFPENGNLSEVSGLVDGVNVLRWTVTNGNYCLEVSDTIMLTVSAIIIPSGYSPNMDGVNDNFVVNGLDNPLVKAELVVTDMSGVVVYENKEYRNDWDGKSTTGDKKYLPDGTYYYFLRIKKPDARQLKGYIIIKRSIGKD